MEVSMFTWMKFQDGMEKSSRRKKQKKSKQRRLKMTKQKIENKLARIGIPATYCGITALVITLLASQLGVCD